MSDSSSERRTEFRGLNWFGKAVYIGASAMRVTANVLDAAADRATRIADDSRRAFERELDPNIEDAKILEERDRDGE